MMWTAFELLINLFQSILLLLFIKGRLHISRARKAYDAIFILSVTGYLSAYLFYPVPFTDTYVFLIPFIYALIAADDPWYVSAFWSATLALLFLSVISLAIHIFMSIPGGSYAELMATGGGRLLFVLSTNALLAAMVHAMSKLRKDYTAPYWPVLALFLAAIVSLFVVEESLYSLQISLGEAADTSPFFWSYIGLLLCVMLFILLFQLMSRGADREKRYQMEAQALEQAKQYQQELERMYNSLRVKMHDFKQHFQVLEEMVLRGDSAGANAYLISYRQSLDNGDIFLTGSSAVDSLLYAKSLTMKKHGIIFEYLPYSLDRLPISEPDFCALIGNLLDNAIEGAMRVTNAKDSLTVHLSFSRSWDMFYIYCANPCNAHTIRRHKSVWRSSKRPDGADEPQALGISNMERIAREAAGRCVFSVSEGMFMAKVVLPYSMAETGKGP